MPTTLETQTLDAEAQLRRAMLASDTHALNQLLAPSLIFTDHLGHILGKQDDLAAHRSGLITITALTPSEQRLQLVGPVAIVSVHVQISGTFAGQRADGDFRFTRIWAPSPSGALQLVAGHSCLIS